MPWKRLRPLLIAAGVVLAIAVTAIVAVTGQHKPPATNGAVTHVEVTGPWKATFTIRTTKDAPDGTIPDAIPLGDAVQIDHTAGNADGSILHFTLDRGKLPTAAPSCGTSTQDVNMAIAAFNTVVQAWIPLETTCSGNELTAAAPHFSLFRAWIVKAGEHVYHWTAKGVERTVKVVTTITTRIISLARDVTSYLGELVKAVTATFFDNLLGKFDDSKYVCDPASTKYTVDVHAASNAAYHNNAIAGCTVGGGGEQVHIRNGGAIPLAFGSQNGTTQYLKAVPGDPANLDFFGLLEGAFAYARGTFLVPGLEAGSFRIADDTPSTTKLSGQMDIPSVLLDLATTVLSVIAPEFKASDTVMQKLLVRVDQRLIVIADQYGVTAVKVTDVQAAIRSVVKENPNWASRQDGALHVVDMVKCLTAQDLDIKGMVEAAFNCLNTVFHADDVELKALLATLADGARSVPELVQANTTAQFKVLTGTDVTRVDVTVNKVFDPDATYQPFVGDWAVRDSRLHLYSSRTGRMDISVGPCDTSNPSSPTCWQHLAVTVRVDPSGVTITYGNFDVTDNADGSGKHYPNSVASGDAGAKGDSYQLNLVHPGFMQLVPQGAHSRQILGNDKMCGNGATTDDRQACNV